MTAAEVARILREGVAILTLNRVLPHGFTTNVPIILLAAAVVGLRFIAIRLRKPAPSIVFSLQLRAGRARRCWGRAVALGLHVVSCGAPRQDKLGWIFAGPLDGYDFFSGDAEEFVAQAERAAKLKPIVPRLPV
jgi:hypothetical protein